MDDKYTTRIVIVSILAAVVAFMTVFGFVYFQTQQYVESGYTREVLPGTASAYWVLPDANQVK